MARRAWSARCPRGGTATSTATARGSRARASTWVVVGHRLQVDYLGPAGNDPDAAIRELIDAARLDPTDELYAMLARAYWDKGRLAGCRRVGGAGHRPQRVERAGPSVEGGRPAADGRGHASGGRPAGTVPGRPRRLPDVPEPDELRVVLRREAGPFTSSDSASAAAGTPTARTPGGTCARPGTWACASPSTGRTIRCARGSTASGAVNYNEQNPIAHFLLGNINRDLFNLYQTCDYLSAAASSYSRMLELNEYLAESDNARNYREQITRIARQLGC